MDDETCRFRSFSTSTSLIKFVEMKPCLLAVLLAASALQALAAPPATYVYETFGERKLQLAAHYPPGWKAEDKRPTVLFFSGAHKVQPDKNGKLPPLAAERAKLGLPVVNRGPGENHVPLCDAFAQRGLVCFRVEYRTRGKDGVLPGEDIADAVSAMRWVRGHAATLGIDPDRVVAAGGSSGGYLAASLFAFEDRYPTSGDRNISARPTAILLYSPLVDWLEVGSMTESFLVVLNGDKELGAKVSPARHWRKDCPPTLVMVGSEEPPFTTVKEFAEKWKAAGAPMEFFVADGGEHGFFGKSAWLEKTLARTEEFLRPLGLLEKSAVPPKPLDPGKSKTSGAKGATDVASRLAGMLARFPEADANKDGVLTMEEAAAFKNKSKKPKSAASSEPAVTKPAATAPEVTPGVAPSKGWDANGDGKISKDEFKGPAQLFQNMDMDSDGFLSGAELKKLDQKLSLDKWTTPPGLCRPASSITASSTTRISARRCRRRSGSIFTCPTNTRLRRSVIRSSIISTAQAAVSRRRWI